MALMRKKLDVVAGLIFRDGRLLAARRRPSSRFGGKWEFPGGKVEEGESPAESLQRELFEELGVRSVVKGSLFIHEHDYADVSVRLHFFDVDLGSGEPEALDHEEIRWVRPGDLKKMDFVEADLAVLERIDNIYSARSTVMAPGCMAR